MRKLVSIFLLALYATTISASVVTVRYCPSMNEEVAVTSLLSQDCCCKSGEHMDMSTAQQKQRPQQKPVQNRDFGAIAHASLLAAEKYTGATRTADKVNTIAANPYTYTALKKAPQSCCSEIVFQSRISANQIIHSEISSGLDQPQLLPVTGYSFAPALADVSKLHQPLSTSIKPPPSSTPLYKLFQRFTYYG